MCDESKVNLPDKVKELEKEVKKQKEALTKIEGFIIRNIDDSFHLYEAKEYW